MADIRQAESQAANDTEQQSQGRSIIYGQQRGSESEERGKGAPVRGALPWSEEAKEAVKGLKEEASNEVVQLVCLSFARCEEKELLLTISRFEENRKST